MIYKNEYFKLDTQRKMLFNKHNIETFVSGNSKPFKFLELLCGRWPESITLTDVNDFFFPFREAIDEREYNEDNLRNLRNEIKKALGHEIVRYDKKVYSIVGHIDKMEKEPEHKEIPSTATTYKRKVNRPVIVLISAILLVIVGFLIFYKINKQKYAVVNDMINIPAGEFIMGSTEQQFRQAFEWCKVDEGNYCRIEDYEIEYPSHKVFVKDYMIDRKEVSNANYIDFLEATGHESQEERYTTDPGFNGSTQPVVGITWDDAVAFCKWAGKRLPTENEWEKAARGTDGRTWPWGSVWNVVLANHGAGGDPGLDDSDGFLYTAPTGATSDISPYGVLNMSGNVFEWVDGELIPYPGNDKYDHEEYKFNVRVYRGGSYYSSMADTRVTSRGYDRAGNTDTATGFRCAKDI